MMLVGAGLGGPLDQNFRDAGYTKTKQKHNKNGGMGGRFLEKGGPGDKGGRTGGGGGGTGVRRTWFHRGASALRCLLGGGAGPGWPFRGTCYPLGPSGARQTFLYATHGRTVCNLPENEPAGGARTHPQKPNLFFTGFPGWAGGEKTGNSGGWPRGGHGGLAFTGPCESPGQKKTAFWGWGGGPPPPPAFTAGDGGGWGGGPQGAGRGGGAWFPWDLVTPFLTGPGPQIWRARGPYHLAFDFFA